MAIKSITLKPEQIKRLEKLLDDTHKLERIEKLVHDLWCFIENADPDENDPDLIELFFALRERVRNES